MLESPFDSSLRAPASDMSHESAQQFASHHATARQPTNAPGAPTETERHDATTAAHTTVSRAPAELDLADLDAELISEFLDHLERDRHNTIGTRNARLAAIRSPFYYASLRHPEHAADLARVFAIPPKRYDRTIVTHLAKPEITALLGATDATEWIGRRDRTMIQLAIETGQRVSELRALTRTDTHLALASALATTRSPESTAEPAVVRVPARLRDDFARASAPLTLLISALASAFNG
jgi:site-specific recombinase XerD